MFPRIMSQLLSQIVVSNEEKKMKNPLIPLLQVNELNQEGNHQQKRQHGQSLAIREEECLCFRDLRDARCMIIFLRQIFMRTDYLLCVKCKIRQSITENDTNTHTHSYMIVKKKYSLERLCTYYKEKKSIARMTEDIYKFNVSYILG